MDKGKRLCTVLMLALLASVVAGCAPEVGSERWCNNMKEKPKGDWSVRETADYTKHCLFSGGD